MSTILSQVSESLKKIAVKMTMAYMKYCDLFIVERFGEIEEQVKQIKQSLDQIEVDLFTVLSKWCVVLPKSIVLMVDETVGTCGLSLYCVAENPAWWGIQHRGWKADFWVSGLLPSWQGIPAEFQLQ